MRCTKLCISTYIIKSAVLVHSHSLYGETRTPNRPCLQCEVMQSTLAIHTPHKSYRDAHTLICGVILHDTATAHIKAFQSSHQTCIHPDRHAWHPDMPLNHFTSKHCYTHTGHHRQTTHTQTCMTTQTLHMAMARGKCSTVWCVCVCVRVYVCVCGWVGLCVCVWCVNMCVCVCVCAISIWSTQTVVLRMKVPSKLHYKENANSQNVNTTEGALSQMGPLIVDSHSDCRRHIP